jgi:hypothetical protein
LGTGFLVSSTPAGPGDAAGVRCAGASLVMNDDGSPGVDAGVSAGANVPILPA